MRRFIGLLLLAVSVPLQAQPAPVLDAKSAQAIVAGCATHATAKNQSHAIVVVDLGGKPVASLRMDGNGWGILDFASAKANASAAWGFATSRMATSARDTPGFGDAPHVVTVAGGLPIYSGDGKVRLGAVGVSGEAPMDDEACSAAGIAAAGLRSSRG